jgi:hypothetical protein
MIVLGGTSLRKAVLEAGSRLDREPTIAHKPKLPLRASDPPPALTLAFDGGCARRMRKGAHRNFEILTGACEKGGKINVFASVFKGSSSLRLKDLLSIPTRCVLDYFHVAMKVRHVDHASAESHASAFHRMVPSSSSTTDSFICVDTYGVGGVQNLRNRSTA